MIPVLLRRRLLNAEQPKPGSAFVTLDETSTHYFSVSMIAAFLIAAPRRLTRKLASKAKKRTVRWSQRHPGTCLSILRVVSFLPRYGEGESTDQLQTALSGIAGRRRIDCRLRAIWVRAPTSSMIACERA